MKLYWIFSNLLVHVGAQSGWYVDILHEHDPYRFKPTPSRVLPTGEEIRPAYDTPDFRLPEPYYIPASERDIPYHKHYKEENRPYRVTPSYKAWSNWHYQMRRENIKNLGCFCTTVYRRLTPLAGCAVITTKHVLTTATSTHLILKDRLHYPHLEDVLGVWYDTNEDNYNSSMYATPAAIYYHPRWFYPEKVNRSHPFSFHFDLSVWSLTYNVYGWYYRGGSTYTCQRATGHRWEWLSPNPTKVELYVVVGYQYVMAYDRKPMPWFKYAVRTWYTTVPCPKTDWGWFICIRDRGWGRFGVESGCGLHRTFQGYSWRYDGLIAIAAFSMTLRSDELNHYFTILDCYVVLDWLMDVYQSKYPYVWLDYRYQVKFGSAPRTKEGYHAYRGYPLGDQPYYYPCPPLA